MWGYRLLGCCKQPILQSMIAKSALDVDLDKESFGTRLGAEILLDQWVQSFQHDHLVRPMREQHLHRHCPSLWLFDAELC